jgi:His-Xaa-Ser system protein HxsD
MAAIELIFASDAHSADVIQRAAYRFSDRFTVQIRSDGENLRCDLYPTGAGEEIDGQTLSAFRAEILDQVLRERIGKETAGIRNVVLALAFSNTGLNGGGGMASQAEVDAGPTAPDTAGD